MCSDCPAQVLISINTTIRLGPDTTILNGDVVLTKNYGGLFIPSHLVKELALTSEITRLSDEFRDECLKEGKFTLGQIDNHGSGEIRKKFIKPD